MCGIGWLIVRVHTPLKVDKLWKLDVPGHDKNFIWRALSNVLPTAENLCKRHVDISLNSMVCNAAPESTFHALLRCSFSQNCWITSVFGSMCNYGSISDWLNSMFHNRSSEECKLIVMICWAIWRNRNEVVWNGRCGRVRFVLNSAGNHLHQWNAVHMFHFSGCVL